MSERSLFLIKNAEDLRESLGDLIDKFDYGRCKNKFGIDLAPTDFNWISPIAEKSLNSQLSEYLVDKPPVGTRYISLDLIEHLKEATEIINKCNERRNVIFELEAKAILSVLEYFQFLETLDSEAKLAELNIGAAYKQSQSVESKDIYQKAFNEKMTSALSILKARLVLHNESGHSLNFGERVAYLRNIYCDDVRVIYERLIAVKRVLKHSFGQKTEGLPNFADVTSKLDLIVWWMRESVREFESNAEHEYFIEKTISLNNFSQSGRPVPATPFGDHHSAGGAKPLPYFKSQQLLTLIANGDLKFELTEDDFRFQNDPDGEKYHLRVIGISVNIIEDQNHDPQTQISRGTRLYYCELKPPRQKFQQKIDEIYDLSQAEYQEAQRAHDEFLRTGRWPRSIESIVAKKGKIIGINDITGDLMFEGKDPEFEQFDFPGRFIVGDVQPTYDASILDRQNFQSPKSIRNINPVGVWHVYLRNSTLGSMQRFFGLSQIVDFSVTFRIGARVDGRN